MNQPFARVEGLALPLPNANVDTDTIIRIEHLIDSEHAQLHVHAFEALRYRPDGSPDPACPFNNEAYRDAPVLVAGRNFGCGSSREHAVWALQALGLRCVIAESFGDIFASNCLQNGLLPICLPASEIEGLLDAAARRERFVVDLERRCITTREHRVGFRIDEWRRQRLLSGLGDIEHTLTVADEIEQWQRADRTRRPWVWADLAKRATALIASTSDQNTIKK